MHHVLSIEGSPVDLGRLYTADDFVRFVTGGNATFTMVSGRTGARFTYRSRVAPNDPDMFFVSTLIGADNETDYSYVGFLNRRAVRPGKSVLCAGKKGNADDVRFRALAYVLDKAFFGALPLDVEIFHAGKCCRCGRTLTTPESIVSGIGPECAKKR